MVDSLDYLMLAYAAKVNLGYPVALASLYATAYYHLHPSIALRRVLV